MLERLKSLGKSLLGGESAPAGAPVITYADLQASDASDLLGYYNLTNFDGDKFPGGFGPTALQYIDYWSLRARSAQLFNSNLYARGIVRRLVTNIINTGLRLESTPNARILGLKQDDLDEYSELVEDRFRLWGDNAWLCDNEGQKNIGQIQQAIKLEAIVCGDCLVVLRRDQNTGLPKVQIVSGNLVRTPLGNPKIAKGHRVEEGVELDAQNRQVAYWIVGDDGESKRVPAYGPRSGRRISWLIYGSDKRHSEVRGQPLIAIILQSLKEIDRYRDSVQRKAVINSMLAIFIKKTEDKVSSRPLTGGAQRKDSAVVSGPDNKPRRYKMLEQQPGMAIETLQHGEEPVGFNSAGIDLSFGPFEESIVQSMAWSLEIPPEILKLSFSSNYSASQAAINEFKLFLHKERHNFTADFCKPVYIDWKISECLTGRIDNLAFLEAWRSRTEYDQFAAWVECEFAGQVKLSSDILKQAKGYKELVSNGWITHGRATAELTGMSFQRNMRTLRRENQQLVDAMEPLNASRVTTQDLLNVDPASESSEDNSPEDPENE